MPRLTSAESRIEKGMGIGSSQGKMSDMNIPSPRDEDFIFTDPPLSDSDRYLRECFEALEAESVAECKARLRGVVNIQKKCYGKMIIDQL